MDKEKEGEEEKKGWQWEAREREGSQGLIKYYLIGLSAYVDIFFRLP